MPELLSNQLKSDKENGVPCTVEITNIKVNPGFNLFVTGKIKRKQRPKIAKRYPAFAKKLRKNNKLCFFIKPDFFEAGTENTDKHLKDTLVKLASETAGVFYLTEHITKKDSEKQSDNKGYGIGLAYDQPGYFCFRHFEELKYDSDSEDSE
jgi:hypothetical protein